MSEQKTELERVYTVPLSRAWITARHKRTRRAVHVLREFAQKHMKSSEIKIDTELNEELWKRGITKPPRRITVQMKKDEDGVVTISLPKKAEQEELEEKPEAKEEEAAPALPAVETKVEEIKEPEPKKEEVPAKKTKARKKTKKVKPKK